MHYVLTMALQQSAKTPRIIPDYLSIVIFKPVTKARFPKAQRLLKKINPTHQLPLLHHHQLNLYNTERTSLCKHHRHTKPPQRVPEVWYVPLSRILLLGRYYECCFCANSTDMTEFAGETIAYVTKETAEWLTERYVSCTRDIGELTVKKEEIFRADKVKLELVLELRYSCPFGTFYWFSCECLYLVGLVN